MMLRRLFPLVLLLLVPLAILPQKKTAAPAKSTGKSTTSPTDSGKAAAKVQDENPIGRWAARHGVNDDLQLWWQFKPNGTVNVTAGAIIRTTYKLEGNTLTVGKTTTNGPPGVFEILFDGGKLYTKTRATPPAAMQFSRIGAAPALQDSLVGQWRLSDSVPSSDPKEEAIRQRLSKMIVSYRPDGTYEARIPLDQIDGSWDAKTRTYTLKNYPAMPYERQGPGIVLVNPLKQTEKHTYYIDQYF